MSNNKNDDEKKRKREDNEKNDSNKSTKTVDIKKEEEKKKDDKGDTKNLTEAEKKKQRMLAWKNTQQKLGMTAIKKPEEQKKEENKDEDTFESYMNEINKQVKKINDDDEKKYGNNQEKKNEIIEKNEKEKMKGLDEEEDELEFTQYDDKTQDIIIPGIEAPKKKLFDLVDHSLVKYTPFRKNFYTEVEEIRKMTEKETKKYRRKLDHIKVTGKNCPRPIKTFSQSGISDRLLKILNIKNYSNPTPIQCQAIPALMKGEDVIGIAKTGSGKTLAFLLPMFRHILDQPPLEENDGPIALLMAPTRELALQIHKEAKSFCKAVKLRSVCIYGGGAVQNQIAKLKRGAEIVVATPGRMIEILSLNNGRITNLKRITYVVLDEADRMFDMGFEPQIMRIIMNIRPDRQTAMFSATFPQKVEQLARKALKKPIAIVIGGRLKVSDQIEQHVEIRNEISKFSRLMELLEEYQDKGSIIIFVDKQENCDILFRKIMEKGYLCDSLHGGKDQLDRLSTIEDFKTHKIKILIATSVAARGLDVKDLNMVVNYEMPNHIEDYVHRVGRTGRAGNKGVSYTFLDPEDEHFAPPLYRLLKSAKQTIPEELEKLAKNYELKKGAGIKVNNLYDGFVGQHGYKFDNEEANKKSDEVKKHLKALGLNTDKDDEIEDSDEEGNEKKNDDDKDDIVIKKVEPISQNTSTQSIYNQATEQIQKYKFNTFANSEDALKNVKELTNYHVNKSKMLKEQQKTIGNGTGENQTRWQCEIEINDYPQQSRWRVTQKDALAEICDMTDTAIITKGTYVVPGRKAPLGQRKLFLHIEGASETSVKMAKKEIFRRISEESSSEQAMSEKTMYAKYSVL